MIPGITKVARCIFPEGKTVLVAYGEGDRFLLGITIKPKSASKWLQNGVSGADRRRMRREVKEHYGAQSHGQEEETQVLRS